jgi:hypothetical protein
MNSIQALLQHTSPAIRDLGQKAVQYKAQRDRGELSEDEYKNLCAQLTDLDALEATAKEEEERQAIAVAVQFLLTFLKMAV